MYELAFQKFTLSNGLQVVLHEDHALPTVGVNLWYHVGSKNEEAGRTGFAHLFEHVMFEGSKNHNRLFFEPLQKIGAAVNGSTSSTRPTTGRPCRPTTWSWRCGSSRTGWDSCWTRSTRSGSTFSGTW